MTKKLSDRIREIEAGPWAIVVPTLISEIEKLEQQLTAATDQIAAAVAACKVKDEMLYALVHGSRPWATSSILEVLAVTPSISEWKTRWQKEIEALRKQLAEQQLQGLDGPVPNLKPADDCGIRYVE